jgi:(2Fe-2S) ferredoxin
MRRPTVFVCRGSSCRHQKAHDEVRQRLGAVADVADVRCQHVCDGPVVGVAINGSLEWFARMSSEKAQRRFVDFVTGSGRMRHSLEKRRVAKRSGRLR